MSVHLDRIPDDAEEVDYIVIGAGVGGLATATRAAELGKSVVLIENKVIEGCSVNAGSIPKKIMWNLSCFLEETKLMKHYGIENTDKITLDYAEFKSKLDAHVER